MLGQPFTCFSAENYDSLLIVDPEEEFFPEEIEKIHADVAESGLNMVVFADWFNVSVMNKIRFYDENTKQWWEPETGGSNVPALNQLLAKWDIALSGTVLEGKFQLGDKQMYYASGANVLANNADLLSLRQDMFNQGEDVLTGNATVVSSSILSMTQYRNTTGTVAVYGDSNCLDSAHQQQECWWLIDAVLQYVTNGYLSEPLRSSITTGYISKPEKLPGRISNEKFAKHSKVIREMFKNGSVVYETLPDCRRPYWVKPARILNWTLPKENFFDVFKPLSVTEIPSDAGGRYNLRIQRPQSHLSDIRKESDYYSFWEDFVSLLGILRPKLNLHSFLVWTVIAVILFFFNRLLRRRRYLVVRRVMRKVYG